MYNYFDGSFARSGRCFTFMPMSRKKILWLCSWYPDRVQPFNGDFVQRHARAAALYNDIYVVHVAGDINAEDKEHIINRQAGLTEHIVYYKKSEGITGKLFSFHRWWKMNKKVLTKYIEENGKPDLVHVHVAMKAGLVALWIKKRFGIEYVLSEHWSGYLPEAEDNIYNRSGFYKTLMRKVIRAAKEVLVVSDYLGKSLSRFERKKRISVIPNVVDTGIFSFRKRENEKKNTVHFIHISTLNHPKNPEGIFGAFGIAKEKGLQFRLMVVCNDVDKVTNLARRVGIAKEVDFYNERPQQQLQELIQQSDALVLFSRYETFGCVVAEANACGKPVIVSDIPAMQENVVNEENGIFAVSGDTNDLADKLIWFDENKNKFIANVIADGVAKKFSFDIVGKMFDDVYKSTTKKEAGEASF